MDPADELRVGVLSLHNSKETKAILNAVDALGHRPVWIRRENMGVEIRDGEVRLTPDVDVILNRLLLSNTEHSCELLGLADTVSGLRPILNHPDDVLTAFHKFSTATTLAAKGIRVPDALMALGTENLNEGRLAFGAEAVYKTAIGTHGGGTWKVTEGDGVNPMVGDRFAFLQSMISRDSKDAPSRDLRVYVVDGEIVGAMFRYAPENDWRTNVALGGTVEAVEDVPDEAADFATRATAATGLDYAGVDLVEGNDGWYVLEVNPTAGFKGLYRATGRSPAPHLARLAIETAGGEVDAEDVYELSRTLDDSTPRSMPGPARPGLDEELKLIGYTEEVLVSGTAGTQQVVAKSDTGASRTSIDTSLAAEIGAGPIRSMTRVRSGSVSSGRSRPVVDIVVGIGGDRHTVSASLEDRSHMNYALLLGRDILKNYQVDVRRRHDADLPVEDDLEEEEEETEVGARRA